MQAGVLAMPRQGGMWMHAFYTRLVFAHMTFKRAWPAMSFFSNLLVFGTVANLITIAIRCSAQKAVREG